MDDHGRQEPDTGNAKCLPNGANPDGSPNLTQGSPASSYSPGVGALVDENGQPLMDKTGNVIDQSTTCQWPSVRYTPGAVAVVGEGEVFQQGYGTTATLSIPSIQPSAVGTPLTVTKGTLVLSPTATVAITGASVPQAGELLVTLGPHRRCR